MFVIAYIQYPILCPTDEKQEITFSQCYTFLPQKEQECVWNSAKFEKFTDKILFLMM